MRAWRWSVSGVALVASPPLVLVPALPERLGEPTAAGPTEAP